jgi:beta-glucanase (GH16 family)
MNFKFKHIKVINFSFILLFFIGGCTADKTQGSSTTSKDWVLTWSDEFDGEANELPDAEKWTYDIGTGNNGWGNQELQYYTNRAENAAMDGNGNLVITAKKEAYGSSQYTSARLKTQGLFSQKYGKFEARLKTPYGQGLWPAFWMLGDNITTAGWPECGEIDIMELKGQLPTIIAGTVHGPGYSAGNAISKNYTLVNARFDTDYHIFTVIWDESSIKFYVDDTLYHTVKKSGISDWVFNQNFFIIMNVAVGGNYVGAPNTFTTFPQTMTIDYVRVYE